MSVFSIRSGVLIVLLQALFSICLSQNYNDLEALGVNCPSRDKCQGYRNNLTYIDRSCECDPDCTAYKDCCIDAVPSEEELSSRPAARTDVKCIHYGTVDYAGVYVISKCSDSWSGSRKIRQRCTGSDDFSDPFSAVPTTDVVENETYRNLACAKCNYVNLTSLTSFKLGLKCPGLEDLTRNDIMSNLTYDSQRQLWGAYKLNRFGNGTEFFGCNIIFDVPEYLNNSVRFCRSNLVSTCASNWTRPLVARQCAKYMAVVFSSEDGYRNPHCAICNHKNVYDVSCQINNLTGRRGASPYPIMLDINPSDGNLVGQRPVDTPECPSGEVYDIFFKRCRQLVCALPGRVVVNGRCVKL